MHKLKIQMPSNPKLPRITMTTAESCQISMNSHEWNQGSNSKVPMLSGAPSYPSWDHTSICTYKVYFQSLHASIDAQQCPVSCLWEPRRQHSVALYFRIVWLAKARCIDGPGRVLSWALIVTQLGWRTRPCRCPAFSAHSKPCRAVSPSLSAMLCRTVSGDPKSPPESQESKGHVSWVWVLGKLLHLKNPNQELQLAAGVAVALLTMLNDAPNCPSWDATHEQTNHLCIAIHVHPKHVSMVFECCLGFFFYWGFHGIHNALQTHTNQYWDHLFLPYNKNTILRN